ncbi:MAG: hypothetical protein ACYSRR_08395 [Planctomycetota bacterium]
MPKPMRKKEKTGTDMKDLVVVSFVQDNSHAKDYETLLRTNDIPVVIKEQPDPDTDAQGVAVMVPEEFLDEAHVIIESQDAYDDFYDLAIGNEDMDDLDSDVFEDDF